MLLKKVRRGTRVFLSKRSNLFLLVVVLIIAVEAVVLLLGKIPSKSPTSQSLGAYAERVIAKCASASYRPSCYDKQIPQLMDFISMEQAFEVTRIVQSKDSSYQYCHVLGHELSARETKKDPSKWKDVITRAPAGICSNGAIHGAFQERFRKESLNPAEIEKLKPDLADVCEKRGTWNPTGMQQATCYHALGHLTMYITGADTAASTMLCEELSKKSEGRDYTQLCFDGVFMQIFQPLEPEDFALVEGKQPKKEDVASFCSQYPSPKRNSCRSESWPLFRAEIQTPSGLVKFCDYTEDSNQRVRCYNAMFYVITPILNFDLNKIKDFCSGLIQEIRGQCFANAASRMIETDTKNIKKSVELCASAASLGVGENCYEEMLLYSTYNSHVGSKEFYNLCNSLPNSWKEKCLAKASTS